MGAESIFVFPEHTKRTTGKDALRFNIMAVRALSETLRTTLGPKGMDKMIVDTLGEITVTNDGFSILSAMSVMHPAARVAVEAAKAQQDRVGDGTTTVVILAAELLNKAGDLLDQNIHPTLIGRGYRLAYRRAKETLEEIAEVVSHEDEEVLTRIAVTAMTGKGAEGSKDRLAKLALAAVRRVVEEEDGRPQVNMESIKVERRIGGSADETELIEGVVLDRGRAHPSMPRKVAEARAALFDCAIEIPELGTEAQIQIADPSHLAAFLKQEGSVIQELVDAVVGKGATAVFCQRGIQEAASYHLARAGVLAVVRVPKSDLEKLARATGSRIVADPRDLSPGDLGFAGQIREEVVGGREMVFVEQCRNPRAVTLLASGGTDHAAEEVRRALDDAIRDIGSTLRVGRAVGGAGAVEVELGRRLRAFAAELQGKERMAVQAYASALEIVPRTLAENAGMDLIEVLTELEVAHDRNERWAGIDVNVGRVVDSWKEGIIEPLEIKTQALGSATEVAVMMLRVDDVIVSEGIPREVPSPASRGSNRSSEA